MFKKLYPYKYIDSVFSIDYNKLYKEGYKAIIFDIDNTLVHHGKESTKEIDELFKSIHKCGFKTLLLTNNSEERTKTFIKNIDTLYLCNAEKPKKKSFLKAVNILKLNKNEVVFIGDQIFNDIYGANKAGIDNILVKYLRYPTETKIGKQRFIEQIILKFYLKNSKYYDRIKDILIDGEKPIKQILFCNINMFCYNISQNKEVFKRHMNNTIDSLLGRVKFAKKIINYKLKYLVDEHSSNMIKRGKGIDLTLQKNKAININIASKKINGIIINPGETFSLWKILGKISKRKGYKNGRTIRYNKLIPGVGGGLCNLGNTIHLLVLHSPLDIVEFHNHSDALSPDTGMRVPLSSGTSVSYNTIDYRFKNNTTQKFQLLLWCEGDTFFAELRSDKKLPYIYELCEEDHHFKKEGNSYFRKSKIYIIVKDKKRKKIIDKKLVLDNNSKVLYDYHLIPKDQIRN